MNPTDLKYCGIVSTRVEQFKVKGHSPYKANFRCPICGDSQKSEIKARGWLLELDDHVNFYCHNCGASMSLGRFLKTCWPPIYNEYVVDRKLDRVQEEKKPKKETPLDKLKMPRPKFEFSPLKKLKKVSALKPTHPVKKYIEKRRIPASQQYKLYYAPRFKEWVEGFMPRSKTKNLKEEPRLIIPFIDQDKKLFGFTGRAFDNKSLRYITFMIDETMPKVFGLDSVDMSRQFFVVEGALDSLFIYNAIAMAGADIKHLDNNAVYVFDNEPRNEQICDRMEKILEQGHKLVIWPSYIPSGEDINDLVTAGFSQEQVNEVLTDNIYEGLMGKLQLSNWRKV